MPPRQSLVLSLFTARPQHSVHPRHWLFSRSVSSNPQSFAELASRPSSKYQIYTSQSDSPFLNLSIEHFLLRKTPANSTLLFFYVNRPCVVIGRNQNPWLEADLKLLAAEPASLLNPGGGGPTPLAAGSTVDIVRRRSGGGAVFHDAGNINYCVICPTEDFTRDKHVEMVVEALRRDNPRARVNERHDIVLDQGAYDPERPEPDTGDMHATRYQGNGELPPLKVSGSAYKLTRTRSLHHGTCLLNSPNLKAISRYLKSPGRHVIKARGVDSVRSPVGNVYEGFQPDASSRFQAHVLEAFASRYGLGDDCMSAFQKAKARAEMQHGGGWVCGSLDDSIASLPEIQAGMGELQSPDWIYGQTPQFTLSSHPVMDDERPIPSLPSYFPSSARVFLRVRSGVVESDEISIGGEREVPNNETRGSALDILRGIKVHEVADFFPLLREKSNFGGRGLAAISSWLNAMFGK
ncbi:Biotin/lipoate A/B protein ligase [Trapelia coarctata]|nr:Biotin/lipoate A/B protein ligase [Trapelia coarctata]